MHLNWTRLVEQGREESNKEKMDGDLAAFQAEAEKKGIKPLTISPNDWLMVDGIETHSSQGGPEGTKEMVPKNTDGYNIAGQGRLEAVGTYNVNNGVISFVDETGQLYVGPNSEYGMAKRQQMLKDAGYTQNGNLGVWLSNGELPTDPNIRLKWEAIKGAEDKKYERVEDLR